MKLSEINYRKWAYITVCIFGICALSVLFFRYLVFIALPFVLAWGIAFAVRQGAAFLNRKIGMPIKVASIILAILFITGGILGVFFIFRRLFYELRSLMTYLGENPDTLGNIFEDIKGFICGIMEKLPFINPSPEGDFADAEQYLSSFISEGVSSLMSSLPKIIGTVVMTLPNILFFIIIFIISAFYFSMDLSRINQAVLSIFPPKIRLSVSKFKRGVFHTVIGYLRSYLVLMLIIFVMLMIGFLILRVNYALLLALIFAVIDLLPVLGVGTMLIPWGVFDLLTGNVGHGIGILILYAVIAVVRQFAEPRIIGGHLGIHPLLTLFSMYAGITLFGFVGMLLGPVTVVAIKGAMKNRTVGDSGNTTDAADKRPC